MLFFPPVLQMLLAIKTVKTLLKRNSCIKGLTHCSCFSFPATASFKNLSQLERAPVAEQSNLFLNSSDPLVSQHRVLVAIRLV